MPPRPRFEHMYTRVSTPPTSTTPTTKEITVRTDPSDTLFAVLATALLLATALTLGGLAAHPFAG